MPSEILIRPYRPDDVAPLYAAVRSSLAAIGQWQAWCHPGYSRGEAQAWVDRQVAAFPAGDAYEFVITSDDGRFLGGVGINSLDRLNRRANLGYWVRSDATGHGVATRATLLAAGWAFAHTDLDRLEIVAAVGNLASRRVAEKAGAALEGIARRRLRVGEVAHDAAVYAILRDAWAPPA
jgi:ribosomal-protein-serine acetyltransferase